MHILSSAASVLATLCALGPLMECRPLRHVKIVVLPLDIGPASVQLQNIGSDLVTATENRSIGDQGPAPYSALPYSSWEEQANHCARLGSCRDGPRESGLRNGLSKSRVDFLSGKGEARPERARSTPSQSANSLIQLLQQSADRSERPTPSHLCIPLTTRESLIPDPCSHAGIQRLHKWPCCIRGASGL